MRWLKRKLWEVGIAIAGMLLLLVLMVWVPVSAAGAGERTSRLGTPVTGPVQATPTEDATVTALSKEHLTLQVKQLQDQLQNQNNWLVNSSTALIAAITAIVVAVFGIVQWAGTARQAKDKDLKAQAEERFKTAVTALGDEKESVQVGGAILLRSFLRPEDKKNYERYYTQIFDLAVAYLSLSSTSHPSEATGGIPPSPAYSNTPLPLTRLRRALISVFKEVFPLVRDELKQREGERFNPRSLDTTGINLDKAYLWEADLEQVWMPHAFLQDTDLTEANLSGATLWGVDLTNANLSRAKLNMVDLHEAKRLPIGLREGKLETTLFLAVLRGANLTEAHLEGADLLLADLNGADLSGAKLCNAHLRGAKLMEVLLSGAKDNLSEADVSQIKLTKVSSAELSYNGPVPREADRNARYWEALRKWANRIDEAQPSKAELRNAERLPVDLSRADLTGADLAGADFRGVKGLTKEQLEACKAKGAIIDEDSTVSSSQSPVSHPLPSQSNDVQTQSAPPVQEGISTPDIGGNSAG